MLTVYPHSLHKKKNGSSINFYRDSTRKKRKKPKGDAYYYRHSSSKGKGTRTLHYVARRDDDWRVWENKGQCQAWPVAQRNDRRPLWMDELRPPVPGRRAGRDGRNRNPLFFFFAVFPGGTRHASGCSRRCSRTARPATRTTGGAQATGRERGRRGG